MEVFRRAANPWGQEVFIGIAWDLMWIALFGGILFVLAHAFYVRWLAPKRVTTPTSSGSTTK